MSNYKSITFDNNYEKFYEAHGALPRGSHLVGDSGRLL